MTMNTGLRWNNIDEGKPKYLDKNLYNSHFVRHVSHMYRPDRVKNGYVLYTVLRTIKRRNAKWIDHALRRSCLLKHVIEGRLEGKRKGRKRRMKM
jgi:hypothetical protein